MDAEKLTDDKKGVVVDKGNFIKAAKEKYMYSTYDTSPFQLLVLSDSWATKSIVF